MSEVPIEEPKQVLYAEADAQTDRRSDRSVISSGKKVLGKLADFANNLPLAGKMAITPTSLEAFKEKNPYYKTVKTLEAEALLGVMVLAHGVQAGMGADHLSRNLERFSQTHAPDALLACGIDVAYTAANCAATYAQLHLAGRLGEHFIRTRAKSVPRLEAWGIKDGQVNYEQVAEKLMTAIVNNEQEHIDTFFMILPKDEKKKVMESINAITDVVDETYSHEEIGNRIDQLNRDVDNNSRFGYIRNIMKNAHKSHNTGSPYSFREQMKMITVTLGGQIGFLGFG